MTNAEIIYKARVRLAADGKIGLNDGEPEEIHTYDHWKKLGYQVLRGEKAVCRLNIWKPVPKKQKPDQDDDEQKEVTPYMIPKTAFFFSRAQVDSIA